MKKLMLVVLAVCCLAAGCFAAFAACANEHEHTLEYFEAQAPTCVDSGHKEYWRCTECGAYFGDAAMTVFYGKVPSVPATGEHSWSEWTGEVTCEHGGEQVRTCTVCGSRKRAPSPPGIAGARGSKLSRLPARKKASKPAPAPFAESRKREPYPPPGTAGERGSKLSRPPARSMGKNIACAPCAVKSR